jgi:hypothetical protein
MDIGGLTSRAIARAATVSEDLDLFMMFYLRQSTLTLHSNMRQLSWLPLLSAALVMFAGLRKDAFIKK